MMIMIVMSLSYDHYQIVFTGGPNTYNNSQMADGRHFEKKSSRQRLYYSAQNMAWRKLIASLALCARALSCCKMKISLQIRHTAVRYCYDSITL